MNNWKEYIESTFQPPSDFKIEDKTQNGEVGIYTLTHNVSQTSFDFYFPNDNWKKIEDVQFHNPKTRGWSGEFWVSEFSESEKQGLDIFLKLALEVGWSSKDYYWNGKHFYSKIYWNKDFKGNNFNYHSNGCISKFFFPFFWTIKKLMDLKIIGGLKKIVVEPVNKNIC